LEAFKFQIYHSSLGDDIHQEFDETPPHKPWWKFKTKSMKIARNFIFIDNSNLNNLKKLVQLKTDKHFKNWKLFIL
jgi:hypothetical protein